MLPPSKVSPALRVALDYGPLAVFFAANLLAAPIRQVLGLDPKLASIFIATGAFMVAIVAAIVVSRLKTGRVSPMLWFTGAVVLVFGGASLWFGDANFIKLKPTIIYLIMAAILLFGIVTRRPLLKLVLHDSFPAVDAEGWRKLTRNWVLLFIGLACANEVARRLLTDDQWVNFKVFGVTGLTFVFALLQAPILMRHAEDKPN